MKEIRIATRSSRLAMWQTNMVANLLAPHGARCSVIPVVSTGDKELLKPIYEFGVQGVFTKELDVALLNDQADIAVHSLKDVPVVLAQGLQLAAVLERGDHRDSVILREKSPSGNHDEQFVVASSSIRRRAQWLHRYPSHTIADVRGNIETRIDKLHENGWDGLIMAHAAIQRLELKLKFVQQLDWMLPAPGQGAIAVVCRANDLAVIELLLKISHTVTMQSVVAERQFLHTLKGGCSAPISAWVRKDHDQFVMEGAVHSINGSEVYHVHMQVPERDVTRLGELAAFDVLDSPKGRTILENIFRDRPETMA